MEEEEKVCSGGAFGAGALCCKGEQIWYFSVSENIKA